MTEEQNIKLEKLRKAKQEYLNTEGIDRLEKKGPAKDKFNQLANASSECWDEVLSRGGTPEERREFTEEFRKEIKQTN